MREPAAVPRGPALLLALLSLAATSCDRISVQGQPLVLWAMGSEADAADAVLDGFRAEHPELPVRVQRVPWSAAHEKLLTAFVGGSMPDVFQLGNTWIPEMAMLGALAPLDERAGATPGFDAADFFAGALEPNRVDGRLVAVPWYVDTRLLFFRSDLLTAAGIAGPPKDWQQWRSAMEQLRQRRKPGSATQYGVFLAIDEWQTPVILALQKGARLLADNDTRGNFRSAEVRSAFEFYTGLFADDLAPRKSAAQIASIYREFAAGTFVFFVTGPWNLAELPRRMPRELDAAWSTVPMPSPDPAGQGLSIAGGASLAISSTSTRKDAAWELVNYLTSTQVQARFREHSGDLPSRRSAWEVAGAPQDERSMAFRRQLEALAPAPMIPEWERIAAKITLHLERVVRAESTLDDALAALDSDVDAILAKRRQLRGIDPHPEGKKP